MNTVYLTGRAVKDPELKTSAASGKEYCQLCIAVARGRDKDGNDLGADFPQVLCFGKTAQTVSNYVKKGRLLLVTAKLRTGSYEKNGTKVYETNLFADRIEFLGPNPGERQGKIESSEKTIPEKKENTAVNSSMQADEVAELVSEESIPEGFEKLTDDDIPF